MLWTPEPLLGGIQQGQTRVDQSSSISAFSAGSTTLISGAGVDTLSSYSAVEIFASTNFNVYLIELWVSDSAASAADSSSLLSIGLGPSGSEIDFITKLSVGWVAAPSVAPMGFCIPCFIPAGTRIAVKLQSIVASKTIHLALYLFGAQGRPGYLHPGPTVFEAIGTNTTGSRGTSHTPGNSGSFSTAANIGSTTTIDAKYIQLFVSGQGVKSDVTMLNLAYQTQLLISGGPVFGEWWHGNTVTENQLLIPHTWVPCSIPSGTQLQIKSKCSGTAEAQDFSIMVAR